METKIEDMKELCQSSTFREYLLWKNQNINYSNLLSRLSLAKSPKHFLGIMKSVLYDSKRFQFQDYSMRFIDMIYGNDSLMKSEEITVIVPSNRHDEFDNLMLQKLLFEFTNVAKSFGKSLKIVDDKGLEELVESAVNIGGWMTHTKGINVDFLEICFRNGFEKRVVKFIHKIESFNFMSQFEDSQ